jgi:hypothetical protein
MRVQNTPVKTYLTKVKNSSIVCSAMHLSSVISMDYYKGPGVNCPFALREAFFLRNRRSSGARRSMHFPGEIFAYRALTIPSDPVQDTFKFSYHFSRPQRFDPGRLMMNQSGRHF